MNDPDSGDTICAVSTPPGQGGIGIVRLSGPGAIATAQVVFQGSPPIDLRIAPSHTIHHGHMVDPGSNEILDEVMVSVMRSPKTYTREDVVEINAHGNSLVLQRILVLILRQGIRLAEPGEFTKRAFLNGRIDLTEAEAVMELIEAKTEAGCRAAVNRLQGGLGQTIHTMRDQLSHLLAMVEATIDFSEEELGDLPRGRMSQRTKDVLQSIRKLLSTSETGRLLQDGLATVIIGRPNAGKSSLLNTLTRQDKAIVSAIPGTTRDLIETYFHIDGVPLRVIDTAGLHDSGDPIEKEGMKRAEAAIASADLVLLVVEASGGFREAEEALLKRYFSKKKMVLVINKIDLVTEGQEMRLPPSPFPVSTVRVSATRGDGMDALRELLGKVGRSISGFQYEQVIVVQLRHQLALEAAARHLEEVLRSIDNGWSEDVIALDLRAALDRLGEIVGVVTTEDILGEIFQNFCIGK